MMEYGSLTDRDVPKKAGQYLYLSGVLIALILAGIFFPLTAKLSGFQDSDGILASYISRYNLTFFFWGQDRFLNLIPFLAGYIQDPEFNLRVQLFFRVTFCCLSPIALYSFFGIPTKRFVTAVFVTNALLIWGLKWYGLTLLYVQHAPHCTSLVLLGLSFLLYSQGKWTDALGSFGLLCLAYAVNISLILYGAALLSAYCLIGKQRRVFFSFLLLNIFAFAIAYYFSRVYGEIHVNYGFDVIAPSLVEQKLEVVAARLMGETNLYVFVAATLLATVLAFKNKQVIVIPPLIAAASYLLVVSNLTWVKQNLYDFRYFSIPVIVYYSILGYLISEYVLSKKTKWFRVSALFLVVSFIGLGGFRKDFQELVDYRQQNRSREISEHVINNNVAYVIGDYWETWPIAFVSENKLSKLNSTGHVLGISHRSHMIKDIVLKDLETRPEIKAICSLQTSELCKEHFINMMGMGNQIPLTFDTIRQVHSGEENWLVIRIKKSQSS